MTVLLTSVSSRSVSYMHEMEGREAVLSEINRKRNDAVKAAADDRVKMTGMGSRPPRP